MAKRKGNQEQLTPKASDTEFGAELGLSKKARKKAAREEKRKNK
ncbi:hypothetical protein J2Z40_003944 [Cytobacillus eiseniae]|uniref:YfhD family protein n=1 Tax=Cytobacillus eiseniae TaxID=762947 RepID=A0ABS4RKA6_9BACI|nr:hypothetical protein [Cytobacillus eiseniae]MBP2243328.1 hypothetical protein [Cytobacillus eiseniae]